MSEQQATPKCGTCKDTGQVWTPEQDGSGMWDMACPDCDAPYPLSFELETAIRLLGEVGA